jgi:hypothetical protein
LNGDGAIDRAASGQARTLQHVDELGGRQTQLQLHLDFGGGHARGLVDFSKLTREIVARLKETEQKHRVSASIEMLEGLLIFPDLHAKSPPDSR